MLKPDFSATFTRGAGRAVGTVAGVALAGLITAGLHPRGTATVAVIAVLAAATYTVWQASYAAGIGSVTALVVFLLNLVTPDTLGTALDRLVDTIVGGAIAMGAYRLWPTWSGGEARVALAELVEAQRAYVTATLRRACGDDVPEERLRSAARRARLARTNAEGAVGRSLAEPRGRRIDPRTARGALAGLRRVSQAAHSIRAAGHAAAASGPGLVAPDELSELADEIDEAMAALGSTIGGAPHPIPALRQTHTRLARAGGVSPLLVAQTDELVDAIDTVAHLFGMSSSA